MDLLSLCIEPMRLAFILSRLRYNDCIHLCNVCVTFRRLAQTHPLVLYAIKKAFELEVFCQFILNRVKEYKIMYFAERNPQNRVEYTVKLRCLDVASFFERFIQEAINRDYFYLEYPCPCDMELGSKFIYCSEGFIQTRYKIVSCRVMSIDDWVAKYRYGRFKRSESLLIKDRYRDAGFYGFPFIDPIVELAPIRPKVPMREISRIKRVLSKLLVMPMA